MNEKRVSAIKARRFFMFTKPVDTEEVPDYTNIIKQPMDLETMMTKVDFHRYECASDFLNDIELICQNALEYNPARTSADKQIRHRACSLRDYAYTLIKTEMDTDFEDKCLTISRKRRERKHCPTKYLPPYIYTPELTKERLRKDEDDENVEDGSAKIERKIDSKHPHRKRKRFRWQRGQLLKNKKRRFTENINSQNGDKDSSDDSNDDIEDKSNHIPSRTHNYINTPEHNENVAGKSSVEPTAPLTVNCDIQNKKMDISNLLQSPKRRLSDILSPSELLDNPLDFDDVDEALNESASGSTTSKPVECSQIELEKALDTAIRITDGLSLVSLLDLYNQLSRVVKKFSRLQTRTNLPRELMKELSRFKRECTVEHKSFKHSF